MQTELIREWRSGRIKEVYQIQNRIVNSFAARAVAIRVVTTNKGANTPGTDRKT